MLDIDAIKDEIITALEPLHLDKIILFGSYANGTAHEESDLDLFLIKEEIDDFVDFELLARKYLRPFIVSKATNGVDILSASSSYLKQRDDYFYKEILQEGKVLYERNISKRVA